MGTQAEFDKELEKTKSLFGENTYRTLLLRETAAVLFDHTRKEFVAHAEAAGYNKTTAAIQFNNSRKVLGEFPDVVVNKDGTVIEV